MRLTRASEPRRLPTAGQSVITALTLAGVATLSAACAHDHPVSRYVTCMDAYGHIVPDVYCNQPGYSIFMSDVNYYGGGYSLIGGYYAPLHSTTVVQFNSTQINNYRSSGQIFADNDSAARQHAGLPSSGTIKGGSKVTSKGGALDSGGHSGKAGG